MVSQQLGRPQRVEGYMSPVPSHGGGRSTAAVAHDDRDALRGLGSRSLERAATIFDNVAAPPAGGAQGALRLLNRKVVCQSDKHDSERLSVLRYNRPTFCN